MRLPSLRRKLPTSSIVWFLVAAALALVAFAVVNAQERRAAQALLAVGPTTAVVVASHDIAPGAVVGVTDVRVDDVPVVFAPPGAVTATEAAVGQVSIGPVAEGEVLVSTRLAASAFGPLVGLGNVAVTVGFASVPAGFSLADRADAYATFTGARPYTVLVGEDLHVLAIAEGGGSTVSGPDLTRVTLDVDPETARQLLQAAATGTLGLAARPAVATWVSPTPSPTPATVPG